MLEMKVCSLEFRAYNCGSGAKRRQNPRLVRLEVRACGPRCVVWGLYRVGFQGRVSGFEERETGFSIVWLRISGLECRRLGLFQIYIRVLLGSVVQGLGFMCSRF